MNKNFDIAREFCERYNVLVREKNYPPLYIMSTGGGLGIGEIGVYPGSSQRVSSIIHPYSMDELWDLVRPVVEVENPAMKFEDWRSVHAESAEIYLKAIRLKATNKDCFFVACTAALETTRYRRGKNVAYVATQCGANSPIQVWQIILRKIEEERNATTSSTNPEEIWKEIYTKDGKIDFLKLSQTRVAQDENLTRCLMQIILGDSESYPFPEQGEIVLLSEGGKPVNKVWRKGGSLNER